MLDFGVYLANDMYVGLSNPEGKYNFDKIDRVLDFLVNHKIKPFIELGQKPKRIDRTVSDSLLLKKIKLFLLILISGKVLLRLLQHIC